MASLLVPVAYVIVVFGGLLIFSHFYRKHTSSFEPYFPSHPERNTYITLLQHQPPVSDALLKAALIRRAMADVQRVLRIREDKPALQNLLQKGSIGDSLWNSLLAAEKELEAEIVEVITEANAYVEGWGNMIFATANEVLANEKMRAIWEHASEGRAAIELRYDSKSNDQKPRPETPNSISNVSKVRNDLGSESVASSDAENLPKGFKTGKKNKKRK